MRLTSINTAMVAFGLITGISPLYANETPLTARIIRVPYARALISGEGLNLKPLDQNYTYATKTQLDTLLPFRNYNLRPSSSGAYRLEGTFLVPNTPNDLTLNWMNFQNNTRGTAHSFNEGVLASSLIDSSNLTVLYFGDEFFISNPDFVSAELNVRTQNLNLEFGQSFRAFNSDVRIHAGIGYGAIKSTLKEAIGNEAPVASTSAGGEGGFSLPISPYVLTAHQSSRFKGAGPRLGADLYYLLGNSNFSLATHGAAALLVGTVRETFSDVYTNNVVEAKTSYSALVPNFNLRLGLNYTHSLDQSSYAGAEGAAATLSSSVSSDRILSLEAGWEVDAYLDPIVAGGYNASAVATAVGAEGGGLGNVTMNEQIVPTQNKWKNNLGLSGFYLKATYLF